MKKTIEKMGMLLMVCIYIISNSFVIQAKAIPEVKELVENVALSEKELQQQQILEEQQAKENEEEWREWAKQKSEQEQTYTEDISNLSEMIEQKVATASNQITFFVPNTYSARLVTSVYMDGADYRTTSLRTTSYYQDQGVYVTISNIDWNRSNTFKLIFKNGDQFIEYEINETDLGKNINLEMPKDYMTLDIQIENTTNDFKINNLKIDRLDSMGTPYSYGYFSYEEGVKLPAGNYRVIIGGVDGETAYLLYQDTHTGKIRFTKDQMGEVALANKSGEAINVIEVSSSWRVDGLYLYNYARTGNNISKVYLNKGITINSLSLDIMSQNEESNSSQYVTISKSNIVIDTYTEMPFDTYFKGEFGFDTLSGSEWKEMNLYQTITIKDQYDNSLSYISAYFNEQIRFELGKQQCKIEQNSGSSWLISVPEQTGNYEMIADFGQGLPIHLGTINKQIKVKEFIESDDIGLFMPVESYNQSYINLPYISYAQYRYSNDYSDDNDYWYRSLYIRDNTAFRKVEGGWEISIANLDWSVAENFYIALDIENTLNYEEVTKANRGQIKDMTIDKPYQKVEVEMLQSGQSIPLYMLAVHIVDENNKTWTLGTGSNGVYIPTGNKYAVQIIGKNKNGIYNFYRNYTSDKITINEDEMECITVGYKPGNMIIDRVSVRSNIEEENYYIDSMYSVTPIIVQNAAKIYTDKLSSISVDISSNIESALWEFRYDLKDDINLTNGPVTYTIGDDLNYNFKDNGFTGSVRTFELGERLYLGEIGRLLITDEYSNEIYNIYSQYNTDSYVATVSFIQDGKVCLEKKLTNLNEWFDMPKDSGAYTFKYELNPGFPGNVAPITREIVIKAAEIPTIKAQIAPYQITVNGTSIDQKHSAYPMLAYEGITYFPMTWNFCQSLGVNTAFTAQTGLRIDKTGTSVPVIQDLGENNDLDAIYEAEIVSYPIRVNGKTINNSTQQYPIVSFRNMTYFPMTWEFANEAFGWTTNFDSASGYSVEAVAVPVPVVPSDVDVTIPQYSIRVNGDRINNAYSDFPVLFYNNITYFPMTWDYCQALGLSKDFSEQAGFILTQTGVTTSLVQTPGQANDLNQTYKANKVDYPITVNGQTVENSSQDYPVLTFRDMIYFPMTWDYTYKAFGWTTRFIEGKGFYISTTGDLEVRADSITIDTPETMKQGERIQLIAKVEPEDATNADVVWKSSNESVISVSSTGELVANSLGKAIITATTADGACTVSTTITVQGDPVNITIPTFDVTLNGTLLHDQSNLYATINYEGITYVPLTWNYCQALGFNTSFDAEQGIFYVDTTIPVGEIVQDGSGDNILGGAYLADIPVYQIIINGEEINNLSEEYPLLNFRNITYFPLTWSFAVERFGWDIGFNESTGFVVNTNLN